MYLYLLDEPGALGHLARKPESDSFEKGTLCLVPIGQTGINNLSHALRDEVMYLNTSCDRI